MATKTLGSNATTTLTAVAYSPDPASLSNADLAAVAALIRDPGYVTIDQTGRLVAAAAKATMPITPSAFTRDGFLFVPGRGILRMQPGDWVGVDNNGWPILLSSVAIAGTVGGATSWTHT